MQNTLLRHSRHVVAAGFVVAALSGCAHTPGRMLWREAESPGTQTMQAVEMLASAQDELDSLRALGTCIVSSPELVGKRKLDLTLKYLAPAGLSIKGYEPAFRIPVLRLLAFNDQLEFEIPETTLDVSELLGQAPPDAIARELFRPEEWGELSPRKLRLLEADAPGGVPRLVLLINKRFGLFRRVVLEGPDWTLRQSELFTKHGDVLVRVEWLQYIEKDGVRVPAQFEATFPLEGVELRFNLKESKIVVNPTLAPDDFTDQEEDPT